MISSGFFNSIKHDRRYNALQFGSIYDGVIRDGIFMSIGTCFQITESDPNSMNVIIGEGRGWFDHSWILNDAPEPLLMPQSELLLDRIDAIVIETNQEEAIRRNSIKVISGEPSDTPQKPTLLRTDLVNQYPLAYVTIHADSNSIRQADIENTVGSEPCPFVTGILETIDTTILVAQWKDEWEVIKDNYDMDWEKWSSAKLEEIQAWYEFIKDTLGEDAAVGLANSIYELNTKLDSVIEETLSEVDTKMKELEKSNEYLFLENQSIRDALDALDTKVNNAIGSGDLAPSFSVNVLSKGYTTTLTGVMALTTDTASNISIGGWDGKPGGTYTRDYALIQKITKNPYISSSVTKTGVNANLVGYPSLTVYYNDGTSTSCNINGDTQLKQGATVNKVRISGEYPWNNDRQIFTILINKLTMQSS